MGRISKVEKAKNTEEVKRLFAKHSSFWGIDKIRLKNLVLKSVNPRKLLAQTNSYITIEGHTVYSGSGRRISIYPILNKGTDLGNWRLDSLSIRDRVIPGGLIIQRKLGQTDCELTLTHEGLNVATSSIDELHKRLSDVIEYLRQEYGIILISSYSIIQEMELAFTFACDGRLPILARRYLLKIMADRDSYYVSYEKAMPKDDDEADIATIYLNSTHRKKKEIVSIIYDKTNEIKTKINQLGIKIYRFEMRFQNHDVIRDLFKTMEFGNKTENPLTEEHITAYLREILLPDMLLEYAKLFSESIQNANNLLEEKKLGNNRTNIETIAAYYSKVTEACPKHVLDEEAFLYCSEGGSNGAKRTWRIIEKIEKLGESNNDEYDSQLCQMHGWMIEDIINLMLDARCYAEQYGYGAPQNDTADITKMCRETISYSKATKKLEYLKYINRKGKPRLKAIMSLKNDLSKSKKSRR